MELNIVNTSRKGWVDALRGLAILLVMYGHCIDNMPGYFILTSPVKMPMFFAISGYVFTISGLGDFVKKLFRKVIIPWLFLGLLPSVLMIPFKGVNNVLEMFMNMLSGKELWFFPCFIVGEIIHYFIRLFCKTPIWIAIASFVCMTVGLALHHLDLLSYAMFNRALVVQPFFLVGFFFRSYEKKLTDIRWPWIFSAFIVYICLCFLSNIIFPGQMLDVHLNRYYNLPYCLLLVYLGLFILFTAGSKSDFRSWIMSFIGQNTLVLYIWHILAFHLLIHGVSFLGWQMPYNGWTAIIKVVWACLICGVCAVILNRYLPFAVGKKYKNVKK